MNSHPSLAPMESIRMDEMLQQLLQEEQELQFVSFSEETAWEVGNALIDCAMRENLSITVDITRGDHQLFHASRPGTSADNDEWIKRKARIVSRFGHSSFYLGQLLKSRGKRLEDIYLIPEETYAPHGGCFPILIKGTGMIGTITVSGLPQEDDHRLVVDTIREYLRSQQ